MITYIVYEESERYPLSSLMFLYHQSGAGGEIFFVKKPENPAELPETLNMQPLERLTGEWRIIFLDCSQAYACENPYEMYEERFRYIEEFLLACSGGEQGNSGKWLTRFSPEGIYCAALRVGLYFHTEEEGYLYSDFAAVRGSSYRYLIFDVGKEEPKLAEQTLFRVLCAVLILAMNEWPKAMLEAGYLYQCNIGIDEEKLSEYIGDMEETRRYISTLLYQERQLGDGGGEGADYVPDIEDRMDSAVAAVSAEGMVLFKQERFPFAAEDNMEELSDFRTKNIRAIQRLADLSLYPERRWGNGKHMPAGEEKPGGRHLTKEGLKDLAKKKQECAEVIFKERLPRPELEKHFKKSEDMLSHMEQKLLCRMTRKSFGILVRKGVAGLAAIGAAYGVLTVSRVGGDRKAVVAWLMAVGYLAVVMVCCTCVLAGERGRALRRLNQSLKKAEIGLKEADEGYKRVQGQACVHRSCSLLERKQRRLARAEQERRDILLAYEQLLARSEGNIQQLLWIFGKQPYVSENIQNKAAVDFSVYPSETISFYMPHYREVYDLVMAGTGLVIHVPFYFFCNFEIKRVFLPYRSEEMSRDDDTD